MKNPYVQVGRRMSWSKGRRDRRAGRARRELASMSPAFAAAYLRGYLGGPRGPFPLELRSVWRRE